MAAMAAFGVMMNKVDKQDLRVLAQSATPGTWDIDYPDDGFNSDDALIQRDTVGMLPICVVEGAHPESGFDEDFQKEQQANARYIAAANPATMLAMLDENEALEKRVVELTAENADLKHPGTYLPSKIDTPTTDAFINEMRAQGVNGFIEFLKQRAREFPQSVVADSLDVITNNAEQYAYSQQLRKESGK